MQTIFPGRKFRHVLLALLCVSFLLPGCEKMEVVEETGQVSPRKIKNPPPPPPSPFYFNGCGNTATVPILTAGNPVNMTFSMSYQNSPGGSYPAFTSSTVNGITLSAPAGTLNIGSGSVLFTVTGTPIYTGFYSIPMSMGQVG